MKTANGNGTDDNTERVRSLFRESANENARGVSILRDISSAVADRVVSAERISARLFHPQPLADSCRHSRLTTVRCAVFCRRLQRTQWHDRPWPRQVWTLILWTNLGFCDSQKPLCGS
jgi:hypothetical protein